MTIQHTATELRRIADILDVLNSEPDCTGLIDFYFDDIRMGSIVMDDSHDKESWIYMPKDSQENKDKPK